MGPQQEPSSKEVIQAFAACLRHPRSHDAACWEARRPQPCPRLLVHLLVVVYHRGEVLLDRITVSYLGFITSLAGILTKSCLALLTIWRGLCHDYWRSRGRHYRELRENCI
jgi:hypothetical protein